MPPSRWPVHLGTVHAWRWPSYMSHETNHCRRQHQEHAELDIELLAVERIDVKRCVTELRIGEDPVDVEHDGHAVGRKVKTLPPRPPELPSKVRGDDHENQRVQRDRAQRVDRWLLRSVWRI
jgi:hypothetical protein